MSDHPSIVLVTGGSSGIGRAAALAFAARGDHVIIAADERNEGLAAVAAAAEAAGYPGTVVGHQIDVTVPAQVEQLLAGIAAEHGRLDVAVNSAGIEGDLSPTHECPQANWDRVIAVNLTGVMTCMQHELRLMLGSGGGAIVNVSSAAGLGGLPGFPAYTAAKHGVVGLTRCAALEYAKAGVRVNCICPGPVQTPLLERIVASNPEMQQLYETLVPMGRIGTTDEIVGAITMLCSPGSSYLSGHALSIDGGYGAL